MQVLPCGRREPLALGHCVSPTRRRCRLLLWRPRHRQRLGWSDPVDVLGSVSSVLFRVKQIQTGHEIVIRGLKRGGEPYVGHPRAVREIVVKSPKHRPRAVETGIISGGARSPEYGRLVSVCYGREAR